jgi:multidrug efflux pump subunit AcrB
MTLGGLALAVGLLVDEGIVCLENIYAHVALGQATRRAALDATLETTAPRLLAMLCVLVMFTPALFMTGANKAMFLPLALAVGFAMASSYILSSTLVPVLAVWTLFAAHRASEGWFSTAQKRYAGALSWFARRRLFLVFAYFVSTGAIIFWIGKGLSGEIFPEVRAGELQVRLRAPAGTDIDGTETTLLKALKTIESAVGTENVEISLGFLGLHGSTYPINFLYLWNGGTEEGVLHVKLKYGTLPHLEKLKDTLRRQFMTDIPGVSVSFEPADLLSQVMSLGTPSPIEVAVSGPNLANNRSFAEKVREKLEALPTLRDVQFAQSFDYPTVEVAVDRERSGIIGPDMTHVSRALVPATWSSRFQVPSFWADPESGIGYQVQTQLPQRLVNTPEDIGDLPVMELNGKSVLLRNVARIAENTAMSQYDRYNMERTITIRANLAEEALSSAASRVARAVAELGKPPARVNVSLRGQIAPFQELQRGLQRGLVVAMVAVLLLLIANFQSLRLSLVVLSAIPAVLAGVALALWLTNNTISIQSFIGAIMGIGIAVANAILFVTFAERARIAGASAADASIEGARTRLRPILMTSAAMLCGMMPIALGLSDSTGQMAPLGCAVVGGLAAATIATLFILPSMFAVVQARVHRHGVSLEEPPE